MSKAKRFSACAIAAFFNAQVPLTTREGEGFVPRQQFTNGRMQCQRRSTGFLWKILFDNQVWAKYRLF